MSASSTKPHVRQSSFALPRGTTGKLAGHLMARVNQPAQRDVAARLHVRSGDRVLEIGYGPGRLLRHILDTTRAGLVCGVDASGVMLVQAQRATRPYLRSGRLDLRLGDASHLPFGDRSFEHVVAVNSVATWPALDAVLADVRRVLVQGGTALVAWHSASSPRWGQRRRALTSEQTDEVQRAMEASFGNVTREDLGHVLAFVSQRGSPMGP